MTVMQKPEPLTAIPTDWVVEDIPAGTFRVNRAALVDEAVFRDEMRSIFERCWLYVGHESEIPKPGDFRARDVGSRPLVFWHGHDGVRRVFYNSCRHRGALVCRVPEGNARSMNCFYHAWTYGSSGALNGLPDEEGYGPIESLHRVSLSTKKSIDHLIYGVVTNQLDEQARCRNVIYSILDPNPTRRITASQVLKSEWGREIKLCKAGEEGL